MTKRMIRADGIELATEAFGDPAQPPLLLIMGQMASMLWWPEEFCRRLADRGRHVIRYDNRDTGHSTTYEPGAPPYTLDDLADDAVRILDAYGIPAAHVVGMSFGGGVGQLTALKHPARVASLTTISTSPFGEDTSHLPGTSPAYLAHSERFASLDWTDRAAVIALMVEDARQIAGSAHPFDAAAATDLIERDHDRARDYASIVNHSMVEGGAAWRDRLRELRAPLLVIHGTADPIFPVEHGAALAAIVPGGSLVRLEGGGHELHEADWDRIIAAIVDHTGPDHDGGPAAASMPMVSAAAESGYVPVGDLSMYYEVHGAGEPLLLLHGGLTTIDSSFGAVLPALAKTRRVIAVEQQAHGHTADIERPLCFERMADDTAAVLRHLEIEWADVFGYSDGGNVGLGLAIRHPKLVRTLAVAATNFNNDGLYPEILEFFQAEPADDFGGELRDAYARVAPHPEAWPALVAKVLAQALVFPGWQPEALRGIMAPTLVMIGDADIVRPEHAVELFRLLPHAHLAVLPRTDHFLRLNCPRWILSMLEDFLAAPMPVSG